MRPGLWPLIGLVVATASAGCSFVARDGVRSAAPDPDPPDSSPVARYVTVSPLDEVAHCIDERWRGLTAVSPGAAVTLHPSLRGLMVSVRASGDPYSRAYAEIYSQGGRTRVDYFVRGFAHDNIEDLRFRTLRMCL